MNIIGLQLNNEVFDEATVTIHQMLKAIYPVSFACYYSVFEFIIIGKDYFMTIQDWRKVLYNVIHNLGNLYDNIEELVDKFTNINEDKLAWWSRIGFLFGNSIS